MKPLAATLMALSVLGLSTAMAHDHDRGRADRPAWAHEHRDSGNHASYDRHRYDRDGQRWDWRNDRRDWRDDHYGHYERFYGGEYRRPWGYRDYSWRRGERLPTAYYARPYVLGNYGYYRLRPPPYGCHWVRVNHDVVLTAIATGVVLEVMHDYFW